MQQKNETNYTKVMSIEEYLTKRKELKEKEQNKKKKKTISGNRMWILSDLYG